MMGLCPGSKATLVIAPDLGYGDEGSGDDIPGGATLHFDIEVVHVSETPRDVVEGRPHDLLSLRICHNFLFGHALCELALAPPRRIPGLPFRDFLSMPSILLLLPRKLPALYLLFNCTYFVREMQSLDAYVPGQTDREYGDNPKDLLK